MFQGFSARAQAILKTAKHEALLSNLETIEPAAVLRALLRSHDSVAIGLLRELNVNITTLEKSVRSDPRVATPDEMDLPTVRLLSPEVKKVIEHAIEEARLLNIPYVGSEHLLLGLIRVQDAATSMVWTGVSLDLPKARTGLKRLYDSAASTQTPTRAPEPVGAYPPVRRVGNLLFISGQGPRQRGSKDIPGVKLDAAGNMIDYDMEAQVRAVMQNLRYILDESGSSWDRIVDMTCFLTNMQRDFAVYNRVYAEYFPPGPNQPCRTTLGIAALPQAGNAPIAFEVKAIATVD